MICPGGRQDNRRKREATDLAHEVSMTSAAEYINECEPLLHRRWIERLSFTLDHGRRVKDGFPCDRHVFDLRAGQDGVVATSDTDLVELANLGERLLLRARATGLVQQGFEHLQAFILDREN